MENIPSIFFSILTLYLKDFPIATKGLSAILTITEWAQIKRKPGGPPPSPSPSPSLHLSQNFIFIPGNIQYKGWSLRNTHTKGGKGKGKGTDTSLWSLRNPHSSLWSRNAQKIRFARFGTHTHTSLWSLNTQEIRFARFGTHT